MTAGLQDLPPSCSRVVGRSTQQAARNTGAIDDFFFEVWIYYIFRSESLARARTAELQAIMDAAPAVFLVANDAECPRDIYKELIEIKSRFTTGVTTPAAEV